MSPIESAAFIQRWEKSAAAERANYQLFLSELCDLIGVPRPDPACANDAENAYVFERSVAFRHGDGQTRQGRIDLYKRGCFILEAKQGAAAPDAASPLSETLRERKRRLKTGTAKRGTAAWDDAMLRARDQAEAYARALPPSEGRPPFLLVVDVGHSIEFYSEFTCTGGTYTPFPSPGKHRVWLDRIARPETLELLRQIWTAPAALDPSKRAARVTREIAAHLAALAKSLEAAGHAPETVAAFLMRCLFTMFAEDVGLLLRGGFTDLLQSLCKTPAHVAPMLRELWQRMNSGGFSTSLRANILQFNGGLFAEADALPINEDQLLLLIEAARSDWRDVEPAIFGTLLERALDPVERHKLGAHYTPRAYVERLVFKTVLEPIRAEWDAARAAAVDLATAGDLKKAASAVRAFHRQLCRLQILDPACGTANFLYVALDHLKRLEAEVLDLLHQFGESQTHLEYEGETVGPHQFHGLEINPRAAAIAELVLWIGHLQGHFRVRGNVFPPQPIIRNLHNIQCRDALIAYDRVEPVLDENGAPLTRWDGRATKTHPVTGREVPDESARVPVVHYVNSSPAEWPDADYVVGNPPFIGARRIRLSLGDDYLTALRSVYSDVPDNCDYVLYWWHKAAVLTAQDKVRRFGFITTNSITQSFAQKLLDKHLKGIPPLSIMYAIPDHPWVESADGAAVRIAMTVLEGGSHSGCIDEVQEEQESCLEGAKVVLKSKYGHVMADLRIGCNLAGCQTLKANEGISCVGYQLSGKGFIIENREKNCPVLKILLTARDMTDNRPQRAVIDFTGFPDEAARNLYPDLYQWILERVKPERDSNNRKSVRENWWLYGEQRLTFKPALENIDRMIAAPLTSKYLFFITCPTDTICDSTTVMFALSDIYHLGVLSSRPHVCWALAQGGTLEDRPRYNKTRCFETFPFPPAPPVLQERIRTLAEQLDAHRKRQQAAHPALTMTGMYNVLEKLRTGAPLTAKEKAIHEQGLVSVLRQLHDDLDVAVFEAYGWPATLTDDEILTRLAALNAARAAEETAGKIRYLRPEYPAPSSVIPQPSSFPSSLPDQMRVLREALSAAPVTAAELASRYKDVTTERIEELLQTLATLGHARKCGLGYGEA